MHSADHIPIIPKSFERVSPLILSNRDTRKRPASSGSVHGTGPAALFSRIALAFDDAAIIAEMAQAALAPDRNSKSSTIRIKPLANQVRATPRLKMPLVAIVCLLISRPSLAQEQAQTQGVTPVDLLNPESTAGFRIGPSLSLIPVLEIDTTYDTNIYNTDPLRKDDLVVSLRPRFTLKTDLPRHQFSLAGGADVRRYTKVEGENSEQFYLQGKAVLDLAERTAVIADAGFRRGIEQRGTAGDQFLTDEPVAFDRKFAGLLVRRRGGFLELAAEGRIADTNYRDTRVNGLVVGLSERDVTVKRLRIRGSAPSSHYSRVFVEASANKVTYKNPGPNLLDSSGYALLAGMTLRLTNVIDLEVGGGYIRQSFDNPAVSKVGAVNYYLQARWTPRRDWEVSAAASRQIEPSPRPGEPAIIRGEFSLTARKALGRKTLVTVEAGFVDEQYLVSGRKDQRFYASAEVSYRLTGNLGLAASTSWRNQNGNALGRDYRGFNFTVGARLRY